MNFVIKNNYISNILRVDHVECKDRYTFEIVTTSDEYQKLTINFYRYDQENIQLSHRDATDLMKIIQKIIIESIETDNKISKKLTAEIIQIELVISESFAKLKSRISLYTRLITRAIKDRSKNLSNKLHINKFYYKETQVINNSIVIFIQRK
jgi:hypothetical protein